MCRSRRFVPIAAMLAIVLGVGGSGAVIAQDADTTGSLDLLVHDPVEAGTAGVILAQSTWPSWPPTLPQPPQFTPPPPPSFTPPPPGFSTEIGTRVICRLDARLTGMGITPALPCPSPS